MLSIVNTCSCIEQICSALPCRIARARRCRTPQRRRCRSCTPPYLSVCVCQHSQRSPPGLVGGGILSSLRGNRTPPPAGAPTLGGWILPSLRGSRTPPPPGAVGAASVSQPLTHTSHTANTAIVQCSNAIRFCRVQRCARHFCYPLDHWPLSCICFCVAPQLMYRPASKKASQTKTNQQQWKQQQSSNNGIINATMETTTKQ